MVQRTVFSRFKTQERMVFVSRNFDLLIYRFLGSLEEIEWIEVLVSIVLWKCDV